MYQPTSKNPTSQKINNPLYNAYQQDHQQKFLGTHFKHYWSSPFALPATILLSFVMKINNPDGKGEH